MIALLAIGLVGTAVGCLAGAWLDHWVRTRHPRHHEQVTGLPARRPVGRMPERWRLDQIERSQR